jgi:hypothetical protein
MPPIVRAAARARILSFKGKKDIGSRKDYVDGATCAGRKGIDGEGEGDNQMMVRKEVGDDENELIAGGKETRRGRVQADREKHREGLA